MNTQTVPTTTYTIPAATRMGPVHYTTASLDRQIAFYQERLGFKLHWRDGNDAGLGAGGEDLLRLTELKGARRVRRTTGLYHTAFLLPTRMELAQALRQIAITQTPIQGMTNHHTHHAVYLPDADGNGIELAWDFPKEQWPIVNGKLNFNSEALSPEEVFSVFTSEPEAWAGMNPATKVGHVHLHVSQYEPTAQFYHDLLGVDIIIKSMEMGAIFVSAGGYHHHIGLNLWNGVGAPPPPADATGLRSYSVVLPSEGELNALVERIHSAGIQTESVAKGIMVRDPAQNGLLLSVEGNV